MKEAQGELQWYIHEVSPQEERLQEIIEAHPSLKAISQTYWGHAPVVWWGMGWDNTSTQRQGHTAGAIMGWGLLHDAYSVFVLEPLFLHRHAWALVGVAEATCSAVDLDAWWDGKYNLESLEKLCRNKINVLMDQDKWEDDSSSKNYPASLSGLRDVTGQPA